MAKDNLSCSDTYTDDELIPFFELVGKGFCYRQSCDILEYEHKKMEWTMEDLDIRIHIVNLSLRARKRIENGVIRVPERYDGLYGYCEGLYESKFNIFN